VQGPEEADAVARHPRQIEVAAPELGRDPAVARIGGLGDDPFIGRRLRAGIEAEIARLEPLQRGARERHPRADARGPIRRGGDVRRIDLRRQPQIGIEAELARLQDIEMGRRRWQGGQAQQARRPMADQRQRPVLA